MLGWIGKYALAAMLPAAVGVSGLGPFQCGVYGNCTGGYNWTPHTIMLGAVVGAVIGVVAMAIIDLLHIGRYWLANRAETKTRRKRQGAQERRRCAPPERRL